MPTTRFMGDFFVYSDLDPKAGILHDYWSGYYTTRPYLKRLGRHLESVLRSTEVIFSLCLQKARKENSETLNDIESAFSKLISSRRTLGLFQHHDAITGTSTSQVMEDFEDKLVRGLMYAKSVRDTCISYLSTNGRDTLSMTEFKKSTVIKELPKQVTVYNPLMEDRIDVIKLKISTSDIKVVCMKTGIQVPLQLDYDNQSSFFDLTFIAELPHLSLTTFLISEGFGTSKVSERYDMSDKEEKFSFTIQTSYQNLSFDSALGTMNGLLRSDKVKKLEVGLFAYQSVATRSGAYLFCPEPMNFQVNSSLQSKKITLTEGPLYKEVSTQYSDAFTVKTRIYDHKSWLGSVIEMTTFVDFGEPYINYMDMEVFLKLTTDMKKSRFFTDTNGFGFRERVKVQEGGIGGNYYPMTEQVYLDSEDEKLTLISDHSHGAASLRPGELEVMLERRIIADDLRGLDEGLMERKPPTSRFIFYMNQGNNVETAHQACLYLNHPCALFEPKSGLCPKYEEFFTQPLPPCVHLLNLRVVPWPDGTPSNAVLMILHKKVDTEPATAFLPNTKIHDISPQVIVKTTFNGLTELKSYESFNEIEMKPFSILVIKLFF